MPSEPMAVLGDVLTRLCPMEMGRVAGRTTTPTGRISLYLIAVELVAETDVEDARQEGILDASSGCL